MRILDPDSSPDISPAVSPNAIIINLPKITSDKDVMPACTQKGADLDDLPKVSGKSAVHFRS